GLFFGGDGRGQRHRGGQRHGRGGDRRRRDRGGGPGRGRCLDHRRALARARGGGGRARVCGGGGGRGGGAGRRRGGVTRPRRRGGRGGGKGKEWRQGGDWSTATPLMASGGKTCVQVGLGQRRPVGMDVRQVESQALSGRRCYCC